MELLKETLAKLVRQHTASSELLLWFGRERNDAFADILGPEVFRAMLTAMERDQFNDCLLYTSCPCRRTRARVARRA